MRYLKTYKIFESRIVDLEDNVQDILLELEDDGFQIEISRISKDVEDDTLQRRTKRTDVFLEVRVLRPWGSEDRVIPNTPTPPSGKYPGNIFIWREIKDVIIRLTEWYYSQSIYEPIDKETIYRTDKDNSPLRFSNSGIEFGIGWSKEEDFTLGDTTRFTSLRMEIKL
jgi:hypothetical protein